MLTIRSAFWPGSTHSPRRTKTCTIVPSNGATICRRDALDLRRRRARFPASSFRAWRFAVLCSACSASSRVFSTVSRSTSSCDCDTLLAKRAIDSVRPLQLGLGDFGGLAGEADLHVVRGLLVGDVVLQLGGPLGHPRDLVVDLRQQRALLHRVWPSRTATAVSTPAFLRRHVRLGQQPQHDRLHFERLRIGRRFRGNVANSASIAPIITQRRKDAKKGMEIIFFAPLRLCVRHSVMWLE